MQIEEKKLNEMLIAATQIGFGKACELLGVGDHYISIGEAKRRYTSAKINKWIKQGLKAEKRGGAINSKIFIKTTDLILYNDKI